MSPPLSFFSSASTSTIPSVLLPVTPSVFAAPAAIPPFSPPGETHSGAESDPNGLKKRGPKTRPGADDRRKELHRQAQKSHREKKETHLKDLEENVAALPEIYKQSFAALKRLAFNVVFIDRSQFAESSLGFVPTTIQCDRK